MSDYLWDKTGEPDAEVERLETLLGTLAHQPRTLELPAAVEVGRVEHAAPLLLLRRAPRPVLTVAAALALMLLAGAWLLFTRRAADRGLNAASSSDLHNLRDMLDKPFDRQPSRNNKAMAAERSSHQQTALVLSPSVRRRREAVRMNAGPATKGRRVEAREEEPKSDLPAVVSERQQTAKVQLVYALRLTGAKLSEVQSKVRGAGEERPANERRNKIR